MASLAVARSAIVALVVLGTAGCAARARSLAAEAPRIVVPATIDETLKAGEDPKTRARFEAVVASPEMQETIEGVAKTAVGGTLDGLSSGDSKARVTSLTQEVASDATRAAILTASREIPRNLAPAARQAIAHELKDPELHEALTTLVSGVAREALIRTDQAVQEQRASNVASGHLGVMGQMYEKMKSVAWVVMLVLGLLVLATFAWALHMRAHTRRYRSAVLQALKESGSAGEPDSVRAQRLAELLQ